MTERVTEGETESSCWGQADGVFTPQLLCLSGKKVHELCLVFMLGNYTKQNESDKSSVCCDGSVQSSPSIHSPPVVLIRVTGGAEPHQSSHIL